MPSIPNLCRIAKPILFYALLIFPFFAFHPHPPSENTITSPDGSLTASDSIVPRENWEQWNFLRWKVEERRNVLKEQWDDRKKVSSIEDLARLICLNDRITRLNAVLKNLDRLAGSKQKYSLQNLDDSTGAGYTFLSYPDTIVFRIGNNDAANFVHETTHGGQFEDGGLVFDKSTGLSLGDDIDDEMEAYKAQFAFDTSYFSKVRSYSTASSFETINSTWILGLRTSANHFLYNIEANSGTIGHTITLALIPVTADSDTGSLKRAYPLIRHWPAPQPLADRAAYYFIEKKP